MRNFAHAIPYEIELVAAGVPYFVYGREPLGDVPEVAMLLGVLCTSTGHWIEDPKHNPRLLRALLASPTLFLKREVMDRLQQAMLDAHAHRGDLGKALLDASAGVPDLSVSVREGLRTRGQHLSVVCGGAFRTYRPQDFLRTYLGMIDFEGVTARSMPFEAAEEKRQTVAAFLTRRLRRSSRSARRSTKSVSQRLRHRWHPRPNLM